MRNLTGRLRRTAAICLMPLAQRAARSYIAGPELADAVRLARVLAERGCAATLGYWDADGDSPRATADHYLAALDALAGPTFSGYLSLKLPALGGCSELLAEVAERARRHRVRIHFDSLGPEAADEMWAAAIQLAASGLEVSCSLPARWLRSEDDARTAAASGITARLVKGQWPDLAQPGLDPRAGFLRLVDLLAATAPRVAIASHDARLAREAIGRLRSAGTACELELLHGLPSRASLALAEERQVPVRFYVPYGKAYLPYCLSQARRQPRLLWWLLRDSLARARS
jgi:proline dehydrogenase